MIGLTKKQQEILSFIQDYIRCHQYSPSYREIMHYFGFSSLGSVSKHLQALKRKGALSGEKQSSRSIFPTQSTFSTRNSIEIELPFIGHLSAGLPLETFPQSQTLAVPEFLVNLPEKTYVLRARGNALNEELIADSDLLLVEARNEAFAGEMIIGLLSKTDNATLVKRYYPEGNYIRLEGHLRHLEPIIVKHEELQIQGVIIGLIRSFK
ncbi:MAG TPA: transcriptional repressor LexA [Waddliaceae bacterium]